MLLLAAWLVEAVWQWMWRIDMALALAGAGNGGAGGCPGSGGGGGGSDGGALGALGLQQRVKLAPPISVTAHRAPRGPPRTEARRPPDPSVHLV